MSIERGPSLISYDVMEKYMAEQAVGILPKFEILRIADGLGFGEGDISGTAGDPEMLSRLDDAIYNSPEIIVPIDEVDGKQIEDDGCADGRSVVLVITKDKVFKRSLNRAKVLGGGLTMTAASLIGTGKRSGQGLLDVYRESIGLLSERGIDFGAHTADHAIGDKSGCGAIDEAPRSISASVKYADSIKTAIESLGEDTDGIDEVLARFDEMDQHSAEAQFSGREVLREVVDAGKVVKQLGGSHREKRIIVNYCRNHTVNQDLARKATHGKGQVFAIDAWRIEDLALRLFPGQPELQRKAVLSELIYSFATAAVLTRGDLPVDIIRPSA